MADDLDPADAFAQLSRLAAENPKEARSRFSALLDEDSPLLQSILSAAAMPGEGRLRQLIANTVRIRPDIARIEPHLRRWSDVETDEFAKRAIVGALRTLDGKQPQASEVHEHPDIVDTYRYVADRLCHRVRNSLTGPIRFLRQLEGMAASADPELGVVVDQLRESLRTVARIVEFDTGDAFFEWRSVELGNWIKLMTNQYKEATNSPSLLVKLTGDQTAMAVKVRANDYLLQTIFWNFWRNAQQAAGAGCEVTVEMVAEREDIILVIGDNGKGFTREDCEIAFADQFKRRGANYGRGLLEVQDAVARLKGRIDLIEKNPSEFRIRLSLPVDQS